jgi:hypothetical protein
MPKRTSWTESDEARLLHLRDVKHLKWDEIAQIMGRPLPSCHAKWDYLRRGFKRHPTEAVQSKNIVPPECDEDRARRLLLEPRDLTASLLGDPLPGYSALEKPSHAPVTRISIATSAFRNFSHQATEPAPERASRSYEAVDA